LPGEVIHAVGLAKIKEEGEKMVTPIVKDGTLQDKKTST